MWENQGSRVSLYELRARQPGQSDPQRILLVPYALSVACMKGMRSRNGASDREKKPLDGVLASTLGYSASPRNVWNGSAFVPASTSGRPRWSMTIGTLWKRSAMMHTCGN